MSDFGEKPLAGKRILFLAAQTPYPPDGGGAIRNLAFLEYLAGAGAEITLLCFGRDAERDAVARRELAPFCAAIEIMPPPTARSKKERLRDLARGNADMSGRLASPAFDLRLRTLLYEQQWASVHFQGLEIAAPYIGYRLFFPPREALKALVSDLQALRSGSETDRNAMQAKKPTPRPRIILDEFNAEYLLQERAVKKRSAQRSGHCSTCAVRRKRGYGRAHVPAILGFRRAACGRSSATVSSRPIKSSLRRPPTAKP